MIVDNVLLEEATGSTSGGKFTGEDGITRYVKYYPDPAQAFGEYTANTLYRALDISAPSSQVFFSHRKNQFAFASEWIAGIGSLYDYTLPATEAKNILQGVAADLLVANWDVVGQRGDNIIRLSDGTCSRIDNGAAFLFRGRGGRKPAGAIQQSSEWEGFANPQINPAYQRVLTAAGISRIDDVEGIREQIEKILAFQSQSVSWSQYLAQQLALTPSLDSAIPPEDIDSMVAILESRTLLLQNKYPTL